MSAPCLIEGCDRASGGAGGRGLCSMHYQRWRKSGDAGEGQARHTRNTAETCSFEGCTLKPRARGMCKTHWKRWKLHGDPAVVLPRGGHKYVRGHPQKLGEDNPMWRGDAIGYVAAHGRVYAAKGKATAHACAHCGVEARDWAYDHLDPNERTCQNTGNPISIDPAHYIPLCRPCHTKFDRARR